MIMENLLVLEICFLVGLRLGLALGLGVRVRRRLFPLSAHLSGRNITGAVIILLLLTKSS